MTTSALRHSPIDHLLTGTTAIGTGQLKVRTNKPDGASEGVFLGDMTTMTEKLGVKGPQAVAWLETQDVQVPSTVYATIPHADVGLVARIGSDEILFELSESDPILKTLREKLDAGLDGVWRVEHQEVTFLLWGPCAKEILAQTCGVDFSQIASEQLVYTRLAVASCAVIPQFSWEMSAYRIWVDPCLAEYLWEMLSEIGG